MYKVTGIARRLIWQINTEQDDPIDNLKLQKLLFYQHGFCLTEYNEPPSRSMLRAKRTHKWFPRSITSSRGMAAPPSTCIRRGAKCTLRRRSANGSSTASTRHSYNTPPPDWCAYRTSNPHGGRSGPKASAPRSCAGRCGRTSLGTSTTNHGGTYSSAASPTSSESGSESTPYSATAKARSHRPSPILPRPNLVFPSKTHIVAAGSSSANPTEGQ